MNHEIEIVDPDGKPIGVHGGLTRDLIEPRVVNDQNPPCRIAFHDRDPMRAHRPVHGIFVDENHRDVSPPYDLDDIRSVEVAYGHRASKMMGVSFERPLSVQGEALVKDPPPSLGIEDGSGARDADTGHNTALRRGHRKSIGVAGHTQGRLTPDSDLLVSRPLHGSARRPQRIKKRHWAAGELGGLPLMLVLGTILTDVIRGAILDVNGKIMRHLKGEGLSGPVLRMVDKPRPQTRISLKRAQRLLRRVRPMPTDQRGMAAAGVVGVRGDIDIAS